MLSLIRCVLIALPLFWVPSDSAEVCCFLTPGYAIEMSCLVPLLETNSPPYTLVNFALEVDPRIDQIGGNQNARIRLNTQFVGRQCYAFISAQSQRRKWLDAQFDNLSRKQKQIIKGVFSCTMITWSRRMLATIKPSGLTIRLPKVGVLDDSRNVDVSLKSIRKELGIRKSGKNAPDSEATDMSAEVKYRVESAKVNLKNRLHRNIWLSMKRRDKPQFEEMEKQLRSSNVELDGVSYTLLIHAHLLFSGLRSECQSLLQEMKHCGVHPSLIRFNAVGDNCSPFMINLMQRIIAACGEMESLNAKPMAANIVQMTRASWLTAVLITRRYPRPDDISRKETEIEHAESAGKN
ncbi:hypothetical protein X943_001234 [Babesia divergens]|uniref:Uncharacterized protein n=1 Tax=Babesia divergens TaxID=32595 RepID=A0AAD9GCQ4_BABDI|nr:hypothetical protein X943_001234 [Babesia divergens]